MTSLPLVRPVMLRTLGVAEPHRKVTWLELFHDLVFIATMSQVAAPLSEHFSWTGLLRFSLFFMLVWWAWLGHTMFATRFDTDDLTQRGLTLLQMFLVAVMGINAGQGLDTRESAGVAAAYGVLRLVLAGQYVRTSRVAAPRMLTRRYAAGTGVAALIWLVSAIVPAPARLGLWLAAFVIDVATPLIAERYSTSVPPDPLHLPERFGLFTLILLGESVIAVVAGMRTQEEWTAGAATAALSGLAALFLVWWCYFDVAESAGARPVVTAADAVRLRLWTYAHLPLYVGLAVLGVGFEHLIGRTAAGDAHVSELGLLGASAATVAIALRVIATAGATAPRVLAPCHDELVPGETLRP